MTSEGLNSNDVSRLADLQAEVLPQSLVSRLGRVYIRAFYRYVIRSSDELLLTERSQDGRIAAGCVVSLDAASLERRLMLSTPLLPFALMRLPFLLDALFGGGQPPVVQGAELILIFTDLAERGRGHAGRLIQRTESELAERGFDTYQVRTFDDPLDPAFLFYKAKGFESVGTFDARGYSYALMRRALVPQRSDVRKGY